MTSTPPTVPHPTTILSYQDAAYMAFAIVAGRELDLFTPLQDGPMSTEQIATALGLNSQRLEVLLYALVAAGLLTVEDGRFSNTEEAATFLVRSSPRYLSVGVIPELYRATLLTAETLRTGQAQAKKDFAAMSDAELESFIGGLYPSAFNTGRQLAQAYDFTTCQAVADVGGGSGGVAVALAESVPGLQATVIDFPRVAAVARSFIARAGADGRVQAMGADAVTGPLPGTYDAAVLKNLIQVLSPDDARRTIANTARALKPGGTIYIVGHILEDSRLAPSNFVTLNLAMLNLYDDGRLYTKSEHEAWLTEAGFAEVTFGKLPNGLVVVVGRRS